MTDTEKPAREWESDMPQRLKETWRKNAFSPTTILGIEYCSNSLMCRIPPTKASYMIETLGKIEDREVISNKDALRLSGRIHHQTIPGASIELEEGRTDFLPI